MKFILGKKLGMTQVFDEEGQAVPVTLVEAGPCVVTQIKTKEIDDYEAIQVGFDKLPEEKVNKPQQDKPFRYITEFKEDPEDYSEGDTIEVTDFEAGKKVRVSGLSKGKGFQGGMKRHGFSGQSKTHGTKHDERAIGSIGSAYPERVFKGQKMPGRMGSNRITIKNLKLVQIDEDENLFAIKGSLPGGKNNLLEIKQS